MAQYLRILASYIRELRHTEEIQIGTHRGGMLRYPAYDQVTKHRTVEFAEAYLKEASEQLEKVANLLLASVPAESWCERKKGQ